VQVAVLGVLFVALAALTDGTYALVTAALRARLRGARSGGGRLARASGGVYLGLGALTVLA
jgi:threonine/homoserine/homoserine lactone efflux protein